MSVMRHRLPLAALVSVVVLGAATCGSPVQPPPGGGSPGGPEIPAQGTATTLDVGNWNLEWFGDAAHGPTDDALQLQNVTAVMGGADLDVWGLEEVVDAGRFASLLAGLPGYQGLLANDPAVVDGPAYYSGFGDTEQKVALVWRTSVASLTSAKVILTGDDYQFAGRPPVEFHLTVSLGGATEELVVIVLHAKAGSDAASRDRRDAGAQALKAYLDATYPTQRVMVIGDFNDDVDTSITAGQPSPYRYFADDTADYAFPTGTLSDAGIASMIGYPDMIDHQLDTNEQYATYVQGSAEVFRADQYVTDYGATTSDHYPVVVRYTVSGG